MTALNTFYYSLAKIRDEFHKYGNFNDANSKLDEITKLISIYLYDLKSNASPNFDELISAFQIDEKFPLVRELRKKYFILLKSSYFKSSDNVSLFYDEPDLKLSEKDNDFAFRLIQMISRTLSDLKESSNRFDFINETFGHFIRDNFRNNIEDAQYMTPIEAVEIMVDIAYNRIRNGKLIPTEDFLVCDPSCGVGTFLTEFYNKNLNKPIIPLERLKLIGQDKVPRMVRLTSLNLMLFNSNNNYVFSGNSLSGNSKLDDFTNKVDLILTNPPFGAKFSYKDLTNGLNKRFPLLNDLIKNGNTINSEILFIDRCISLLKDEGELLAIVPDSFISSYGLPEVMRHRLISSNSISIKSIIELPIETFAQAGTRTKTSIMHLKKSKRKNSFVFIAKSENIGFDVSMKKGAAVKVGKGKSDLPLIFNAYGSINKINSIDNDFEILNSNPSACLVKESFLNNNTWTPNHYNSQRISILMSQTSLKNKDFEFVRLSELVRFETKYRKKEKIEEGSKCLSVLHVFNGDVIDYEDLINYNPKYPGVVCYPGDLLFSKINPRIQRVLVLPELNFPLTCSSEFEILNTISEISNYGIKLLLMLPSVKTQILSLTSGTSSSHNRIKTKELGSVLIPCPKKNTKLHEDFYNQLNVYEKKMQNFNKLSIERLKIKETISLAYSL